jgi:uncharacterized protein (DUF1330 family)
VLLSGAYWMALIGTFIAGYCMAKFCSLPRLLKRKSDFDDKPVIAIFCGKINNKEKFKCYQNIAMPLAKSAGLEMIGYSEYPIVIEGDWPFDSGVAVERFSSMKALTNYRNSPEYQQAKKVRDKAGTLDFAIAIEIVPEG